MARKIYPDSAKNLKKFNNFSNKNLGRPNENISPSCLQHQHAFSHSYNLTFCKAKRINVAKGKTQATLTNFELFSKCEIPCYTLNGLFEQKVN